MNSSLINKIAVWVTSVILTYGGLTGCGSLELKDNTAELSGVKVTLENAEITEKNADYDAFLEALTAAFQAVAKKLAADGEGATKLLIGRVSGAKDSQSAKTIAKSVICSSLVKAAMFGADANCGRILCAVGYSGAEVDVKKIDVAYQSAAGEILVCQNGCGLAFDEAKAEKILLENEITILITLGDGDGTAEAYGCDLTYDYVKINGDYRT